MTFAAARHARSSLATLALVTLIGCAAQRPTAYVNAFAAGDRAWSAGRVREAAEAYDRAAGTTQRGIDHDEAMYRAGQAWRRAGDMPQALERFDWVAAHGDPSARAPRGALAAGEIRMEQGDTARAEQDLTELVRRYPDSGPARRAVDLVLASRDRADPTGASALAWLDSIEPSVQHSDLRAAVLWQRAHRLEVLGRLDEADHQYDLLLALPYPANMHLDDGALRYAHLLVTQNRPRDAIAVIDRALAWRERSVMQPGSYERPHFQDMQMLKAQIQRDVLHDDAAAADSFHTLYERFTDSIFRDDALEQEAALREGMGQRDRACDLYARLANEFPCTHRGRAGAEHARACGRSPNPPARLLAECHAPHDGGT